MAETLPAIATNLMADISTIFACYPPDCQPRHIVSLGNAGGMSGAAFWRIAAACGPLALRRWPIEHPSPERLRWIHAVLRHAARRIDFLPAPIVTLEVRTYVNHMGRLWDLAPWMPGRADYAESPSEAKLQAAFTALAQFHAATADFPTNPTSFSVSADNKSPSLGDIRLGTTRHVAPSQSIARRLRLLRELSPARIAELDRSIHADAGPELIEFAHSFLTLLPPTIPRAIAQLVPLADVLFPLQPCLRDIWSDHLLFTDEKVTGLVDFGAMDFETPAADIARLLGSLVGDDEHGWQAGLAAYSAICPLTDQDSLAVAAFDTSGTVLAGCNWIRWIYLDRRRFEDQEQVTTRFASIVARTAHIASR